MENTKYKVSAFDFNKKGGNPAGVILEADKLSEQEMLAIAKDIGYSETAFVMKSDKADFKVRFFTPVDEVDLCGHATIGTFNLLREIGSLVPGEYSQETKAGILKLQIFNDYVLMEQTLPEYLEFINPKELMHCFISDEENIYGELPIQIVSTGLKDIIVHVKDLHSLISMKPNFEEIHRISKLYDVVGIHAFCFETYNESDLHVRNFAPRFGIDEESATGTANGALCCYLQKYFPEFKKEEYIIEQGYSMNEPSQIKVRINAEDDVIKDVYVGGSAILL